MAKTHGAAGAAMTEVPHQNRQVPEESERPRHGDPLEHQVAIEPAAQPIVSEGSPSMHAADRGGRPEGSDASAARDEAIAARAYELYLERGGTHGADMDDWLQAERELLGR